MRIIQKANKSVNRKKSKKSRQRKQAVGILEWILSLVREVLLALLTVLVIKLFLFEVITVEGKSMLETLHGGDKLYVSLLSPKIQGYQRGDVVICYFPGRTERCVKRIVGLPGETVEISQGVVYINGNAIGEDYLTYTAGYNYSAMTLDEGEYFVLGDNRPISHDSHSSDVGAVERIEGKVRFIIWPFERIGDVD